MSGWQRSRQLTATTYDLVRAEPDLKSWSIKALVYGVGFGALGVVPGAAVLAIGAAMGDETGPSAGTQAPASSAVALMIIGVVLMVLGWIAGATAASLQMAGLVAAADDLLHGRPVDTAACRGKARQRLGALIGWGAISAAVGALVSVIRGDGGGGVVASLLRSLLAGLVAAAWSVITFFVLPLIVLEGLGAVAAVKRSAGIVRHTWGEAIGGSVRIGARFGLIYILPGVLAIAAGIAIALIVGGPLIVGGVVLVLVGLVLVGIGAVLGATCRAVFGVALYRWTTDGTALGPYESDDLSTAVRQRT